MMNPEIKARWLAKLRSGEYKQGAGYLKLVNGDGNFSYCCLGVLCEIAVEDGILAPSMTIGPVHRYAAATNADDFSETVLPKVVANWARINSDGIQADWRREDCPDADEDGHEDTFCGLCRQMELTAINDENVPFDQIADVIEKWF